MKSSGGLIDLYRRPHTKNKASIKGTSRELGSDECVECVSTVSVYVRNKVTVKKVVKRLKSLFVFLVLFM